MDLAYGHCHLQELKHSGLWSYFPWIWQTEKKRFGKRSAGERWVVFLEAATMVDPKALELLLAQYDAREPWYLGRSLQDDQMSIIHHYQQEPAYPLVHAGFALSGGLLKKLLKDLEEKPVGSGQQIEPVWELASRLGLLTQTGPETEIDRDPGKMGIFITHHEGFCREPRPHCATWVRPLDRFRATQGLRPEEVVIAVKTVDKFHPIRLPLLKEFWADESIVQVLYMSNTGSSAGAKIIDLSVDFGDMVDPKKESNKQGSGHCTKMQAILRYLHRFEPDRRWYVVTDDDTLVNVPRLLRVLDSHDDREAIYLGERYGWSHMQDGSWDVEGSRAWQL
ncbi:3-glucosyltransferase (Beta3Glc-T) (Beta 3-glucosyltransferase) (Beta-3-glycosyltransferase-like) [Durusdinium trenchii]|uniref:3-glucosyltransferase (Beta3Glc-T) (Beta 3-glucosyltransferase) (Beta-3-glycosyltransferase-like) n=1 Tax=Durusdinium trenchii TaxID=1381693 RepID=A0ABP0NLH6_9DINO